MKEEIKQKILNEIMKNKVKMKPKYLFWLKTFSFAFAAVFFSLLTFYIFSFIGYLFIDWGLLNTPRFGMMGLLETLRSLPILLIFLGIFAIYMTLRFAKYFSFIYKKNVVNLFSSIFIFIFISQIIFILSGAQEYIKQEAFKRKMPLAPNILKEMRDRKNAFTVVGKIIATSSSSVTIINRMGNILEIPIATITNISAIESLQNLHQNDIVQILLNQPFSKKSDEQKNIFLQDIIVVGK